MDRMRSIDLELSRGSISAFKAWIAEWLAFCFFRDISSDVERYAAELSRLSSH
jgi:hypothetical protein